MSVINRIFRKPPPAIDMREIVDRIVVNAGEEGVLTCSVNDFQLNVPTGMLLMLRHCMHPAPENPLRFYVETPHLQWMCSQLGKGDVVLDIGASGGLLAAALAKTVGPDGRVYAFEPADRAFALLQKTVLFNGLGNTVIEKMAVSNAPGTVKFSEYPFSASDKLAWRPEVSAILSRSIRQRRVKTFEVPVTTVDEYFLPRPLGIDMIKIDVEGFETHVIQGATGIIQRDHPMFSIDIHRRVDGGRGDTQKLLRTLLAPYGYRFKKMRHVLVASIPRRGARKCA
jgi:FkbM family methyltransferase